MKKIKIILKFLLHQIDCKECFENGITGSTCNIANKVFKKIHA